MTISISRFRRSPAVLALAAGLLAVTAGPAGAVLNTADDPNIPQTDGRVETIMRVGPVVYVGGSFTNARPAGTLPGDPQEKARTNAFAFDAHTGEILDWDPKPDGKVRTLAVTPNWSSILLGGQFATVGGVARSRLASVAACSISGATVTSCPAATVRPWHPNPNGTVFAVAAAGGRVYVGGNFHHIAGAPRKNLAAVGLSSGKALKWAAGASDVVHAITVSRNASRVFVGGEFKQIGTASLPHLAALSATTGAPVSPWRAHPVWRVVSLVATANDLYAAGTSGGGHLTRIRLSDGRTMWGKGLDGDAVGVDFHHGQLFAVGHFVKAIGGTVNHRHLMLLAASTGLVDNSWTRGTNQQLGTFAVDAYGQQVYVGGDFTKLVNPGSPTPPGRQGVAAFSDAGGADVTAPTITRAPQVAMAAGTAIGASVPVTLSWAGRDTAGAGTTAAGICRFTVQQRLRTNPFATLTPALPTLTSMPRGLAVNAPYHFRVKATDCADNPSGYTSSPVVRIDSVSNTARAIAYSGRWTRARAPGSLGGSITYTTHKGAGALLHFTGRQVAWVASKSKLRGRANVYIDGHLVKRIDLHATSLQRKRIVFVRTWATAGAHRVKVVCLGTPGRPMVDVDAFLVSR